MECKGSGVRTLWAGGGKRPTEQVVELDAAGHPGTVLGEQLAAAAGQPVSRPGKHVDRTGEFEGVDGLAQHPDRQVDKAVGVEGTSSERGAEPIAELSAVGHPGAVLAEQLTANPGQPPGRAWEGDDRTGAGDGRRPATPAARSAAPSPSKSPAPSAKPTSSSGSTTPDTPGLSWMKNWLPFPVNPPVVPYSTFTAPPLAAAPTFSRHTPTARSAKPSPSKSPAAIVPPKASSPSALLPTPGLSWVNSWLPVPVSPPVVPYSTFTAPASTIAPRSSNVTPTARSANPSPSKSPIASVSPKPSPGSEPPGTPGLSWVKSRLPVPVSPLAVPSRIFTAPALPVAPRFLAGDSHGQVGEAVVVEVGLET